MNARIFSFLYNPRNFFKKNFFVFFLFLGKVYNKLSLINDENIFCYCISSVAVVVIKKNLIKNLINKKKNEICEHFSFYFLFYFSIFTKINKIQKRINRIFLQIKKKKQYKINLLFAHSPFFRFFFIWRITERFLCVLL